MSINQRNSITTQFVKKSTDSSKWLGIHVLLVYLPYLPKSLISFLVLIKADYFLRIPSFFFIVGISRLLNILFKRDNVGKTHLRRLFYKR